MATLPPIIRMSFIKQVGGTWGITKYRARWFETNNPDYVRFYTKVDFDHFTAIQWLKSHGWLVVIERTSQYGVLEEFSAQYVGNSQPVSVPEQLSLGLSV